jgi:opacity protein-like surface antigen
MRAKSLLVTVVLLIALAGGAVPASAEWFGDLYLGGAFTQNSDLTAKGSVNGSPFEITARDLRFDSSITGGGRLGYWFETLPWLGLGLDVAYFAPNVLAQNVDTSVKLGGLSANIGAVQFEKLKLDVTDVSLDLMLRWPGLVSSPQFPKGRLQPYLTVGPAVFLVTARDSTNFGPPNDQSSHDTAIGVKAGFGTTWMLTPSIGLFAEYRFTHFSPTFDFDTNAPGFSKAKVETDVNTHHVLVGVTFRF